MGQGRRPGPGDGQPRWRVPGFTGLRPLGRGGSGEVVLARHDASGTLVAIKYLRGDELADRGFTETFRREAAVLAALDDQHVVRLYEYVESDHCAAVVMELVDGVSLREILSRRGQTTPEAALVVLQGSLLGLAAAHGRGIVHRAYKPENVLVNGEGVSKLTDFGIAARAGARAIPAGTLAYAAPEQIRGAPASPASDVYAATATFYECLTGRPPFTGETAERLMYQHQFEPVPLEPVPQPLWPLVLAGMAKEPERRPADGTVLVAALRSAAAGAYGPGWEGRGRAHLGEAALLLAALWPRSGPPAVQGLTVEQAVLPRRTDRSARGGAHESARPRRRWHLERLKHLLHLRPTRATRATVVAAIVVAVVAAGAVVAAALVPGPSSASRPAPARSASPQPSPSSLSPASLLPTPTPSPSPTAPASAPASAYLATTPPPASTRSPSPSPSPSVPSPRPTMLPMPTPTTTPPTPTPTTTPTTTPPTPTPTTTPTTTPPTPTPS